MNNISEVLIKQFRPIINWKILRFRKTCKIYQQHKAKESNIESHTRPGEQGGCGPRPGARGAGGEARGGRTGTRGISPDHYTAPPSLASPQRPLSLAWPRSHFEACRFFAFRCIFVNYCQFSVNHCIFRFIISLEWLINFLSAN